MRAEFLVLGGARTGESFTIGERATIGSDPSCDVRLDAPGVARFHAALVRASEGGYRVVVVEGADEVVVNGVARREAHVYHGQRISVGSVELQLLSAKERNPEETSADFGSTPMEGIPEPHHVERVWKSEKFKVSAFESKGEGSPGKADHRDHILRGLYLIGHATTERNLVRILERAADAVGTALRPDRIVIVLHERGDARLLPAVVRRGPRDQKGSRIPVSQNIVRKSIDEGYSVLSRVRHDGEVKERPIVSVPLTTRTERVGAIYCEQLPGARDFQEEDLDFLGAAGRIVGLAVERTRMEADARSHGAERDRERSRWHAVVQGLRSGVLILDAEGRIELANPAARSILTDRLGIGGDVEQLADLGGIQVQELIRRASDDSPIEVVPPGAPDVVLEIRPSPVLDPDGGRAGVALLVNDATDERLREARLVQAEKLSTLGEMLAGVAHELNNPFATVLGCAEILKKRSSPEQASALDAILEEAERCRRIVSTLLSFTRQRTQERADHDLGSIAASVLELVAHDLNVANIQVFRDLPPLAPVHADRYELQQVFFNLIRNARDAIKSLGTSGKIAVVASRHDDTVRVEVRDSGPGLPHEAHGLLTPRPFYSTKGEKGTGLGLSIANGIVRDHGGQIYASTAPEGGACFAIEIPVSAHAAASFVLAGEDGEPADLHAGGRRRILIVDDEEHVRDLLAQICRELGHAPIVASNGAEALAILAGDDTVAAVLSDVRMPHMDGIALFEALRTNAHPLLERLVFLSGDLARPETSEFLKRAGRPVLPKPFRLAQVCRALEDVLATA
ncbi:MAG: ATP-binding protein [Planctomycetota bacterium]